MARRRGERSGLDPEPVLRLDTGEVLRPEPPNLAQRLGISGAITVGGALEVVVPFWVAQGRLMSRTIGERPLFVDPLTVEIVLGSALLGIAVLTANMDQASWEWGRRRIDPIFTFFGVRLLVTVPVPADIQIGIRAAYLPNAAPFTFLGALVTGLSLGIVSVVVLVVAIKNDAINIP